MFGFESVAAGYFVLLALGAAVASIPARAALRGAGASAGAAILVVVASRALPDDPRLWLAHLYLALGYWIPSLLTPPTPLTGQTRFEAWLRQTDLAWRSCVRPLTPLAAAALELAYLACYVVVPAAFLTVWTYGTRDQVDRFWMAVLLAGFACYVSLPWLVSRPPRMLEEQLPRNGVASFNVSVLRRVSHQFNTFPSGHVAVAIATSLSVWPVSRAAAVVFGGIAAGIAVGAAIGRYHYGIDVLAGALVGVAVALGVR
jgi:membrane-associated phospholipid phosphatase